MPTAAPSPSPEASATGSTKAFRGSTCKPTPGRSSSRRPTGTTISNTPKSASAATTTSRTCSPRAISRRKSRRESPSYSPARSKRSPLRRCSTRCSKPKRHGGRARTISSPASVTRPGNSSSAMPAVPTSSQAIRGSDAGAATPSSPCRASRFRRETFEAARRCSTHSPDSCRRGFSRTWAPPTIRRTLRCGSSGYSSSSPPEPPPGRSGSVTATT